MCTFPSSKALNETRFRRQARDPVDKNGSDSSTNAAAQPDFLGKLLQSSYQQQRPGQGELRHDTEGWRSLESSFKALQVWWCTLRCHDVCCSLVIEPPGSRTKMQAALLLFTCLRRCFRDGTFLTGMYNHRLSWRVVGQHACRM